VITEGAGLHVGGLPIGPVHTPQALLSLALANGVKYAEWLGGLSPCMSGLDA